MCNPNPQNIRDLRLMYDTSGTIDGTIEYERLMPPVMSSREYHEGDITHMALQVIPDRYFDIVYVCVRREQVTNLREDGVYSPKRITDWSKEYTFAEFEESPFYQMCMVSWGTRAWWDTHLMDDHDVFDDDSRWGVYAHVYEHRRSWLGNWDKTGRIAAVDFSLDEDGNVEMGITNSDKRECVYDGDVWELKRIVEEHEEMRERLDRLKEHGVDLDNGTLSVRLWEQA